jgi:hypothetical protein
MIAYIKTSTAAAWDALYVAHLSEEIGGERRPLSGAQIDTIGTVYHQTGTTVVEGVTIPTMTAQPGWHVNVIADEIPSALHAFLVNPERPQRVYFGAQVLSMPEPLPEAGGTAMIERGVGGTVPDEVIARIERAVLRGRLTTEQAADRIALIEANIAIVDAREARAQAIQARDAAIAAVLAADAARDALVAERDAQQAIRADAIAQLATLTGAARLPVVAVRNAAVDELTRIVPLLVEANAALAVARGARDAAVAALVAANAEIVSLRAARDALLPG